MIELEGWKHHAIVWGLAFFIPAFLLSHYIPEYTSVQLNAETFWWFMGLSFGFSVILVGVAKGILHLGFLPIVLGFYLMIVSGAFLYGGLSGATIDPINLNPFVKEAMYDLSVMTVNIFVGIGGLGVLLFVVGIIQIGYRFIYGWKS